MRRAALAMAFVIVACGGDSAETTSTTVAVPTTTVAGSTTSVGGGATTTITTLAGGATTTTTGAAQLTTTTAVGVGTSIVVFVGTTVAGGTALIGADGMYAIDWEALTGPVIYNPPAGADPFFHVHNTPAQDGFFFSVEAYTDYGTWSGELGTFAIGCSPSGSGICVFFDPDGSGPMPDLGADFLVTGTVEIQQADAENFVAVFSNLEFSDGSTIPNPFIVSG